MVRAGSLTGRQGREAERLGFHLAPARQLKHIGVVGGAYAAFDLAVVAELQESAGDPVPFVGNVIHEHRQWCPATGEPMLFLGYRDGARWTSAGVSGRPQKSNPATGIPPHC
jgi:hypothetical protein